MEYGGCLHFEINSGSEYYQKFEDDKVDVDSGRSGLQYILETYSFKRLWLPVYNCPLVEKRVAATSNIEIIKYNLHDDFSPEIAFADFEEGDALIWVNYCGVMFQELIEKVAGISTKAPVKVILDNIPAYFSEPRMNAFNLYSCRKFLGVPDGGHVIYRGIKKRKLQTYDTSKNFYYLLKAIESGSDSAYGDYQLSEQRISLETIAYGMPFLTSKILKGIDYESIKIKRKKNFDKLHKCLASTNRMKFDQNSQTPSVYPYLSSSRELRQRLLDNKIYVSRFWKHVLTNELANSFEKDLAEYLIPLPIDQRYDIKDMDYIANKVIEIINE